MERVRHTFITLGCVLLFDYQKTFGTEVKMNVKPGDNVTLFGDCVVPLGSHIFWNRNSNADQSSISLFAEDLFQGKYPRFHFVHNRSSNSFDLHIRNVSVYDEGIYFCAKVEKKIKDLNDKANVKLEYQYGHRRTHLSLLDPDPPEVPECICICWKLFMIVCLASVLLSSILSAACVYCFCRAQTTGSELFAEIPKSGFKIDPTEIHHCEMSRSGKLCLHSEVTYRLLSSAHPYSKM